MLEFLQHAPLWVQIISVGCLTTLGLYIILLIVRSVIGLRTKTFNGSTKNIEMSLTTIAANTTDMKELMAMGFGDSRERLEKIDKNLGLAMDRQIHREDLAGLKRRRKQ